MVKMPLLYCFTILKFCTYSGNQSMNKNRAENEMTFFKIPAFQKKKINRKKGLI